MTPPLLPRGEGRGEGQHLVPALEQLLPLTLTLFS
jgi:hypothetical protein